MLSPTTHRLVCGDALGKTADKHQPKQIIIISERDRDNSYLDKGHSPAAVI